MKETVIVGYTRTPFGRILECYVKATDEGLLKDEVVPVKV